MDVTHRVVGLAGTLVIAALALAGGVALVRNYVVDGTDPTLTAPTAVALVIAVGVVFGLFVLGARSDRWLENPYW